MKKRTGVLTPARTRAVEVCWVLTGAQDGAESWRFRRRQRSAGDAASVEAAWEWALAREERFGDVVGFFHTHPRGAGARPSARDIRTMKAWCSAFGKPLLCVIADGNNLNGYFFSRAGGRPQQVERVCKGERGWYTLQV